MQADKTWDKLYPFMGIHGPDVKFAVQKYSVRFLICQFVASIIIHDKEKNLAANEVWSTDKLAALKVWEHIESKSI